jgi:mannose-6-phosphate isomerase-like protein (cupin superfamily)
MATEPEVLVAPLLHRSLGTLQSEFVVQEHLAPEGPGGIPRKGIPLHRHRIEDEAWYILEGTLRFQHGTREFSASAGAGVFLAHGTPHTFWNPGPGAARYLMIMGPRTAGLLEALHRSGARGAMEPRQLYASFDVDLLE